MKIEKELQKVFEDKGYCVSTCDRWGRDFRVIILSGYYTMMAGVEVLSVHDNNIQLIIRRENVSAFLEKYSELP